MKKILQTLCLTLVFLVTGILLVGCKDNSNFKKDVPSTETEISLHGTQAEFKDFEKISSISYSITVSNETETFNFNDYVKTAETSEWLLSKNTKFIDTIPNKTSYLNIGDNYFYVLVTADDNSDKIYTLKVKRRQMYPVCFYFDYFLVDRVYVEEGQKVKEPSTSPEKNGYEFLGWDFDFETPITNSQYIYAKYNTISYNINYYCNGGTIDENTDYPKSFYINTSVSKLPTPTKPDYTFSGWYDNPSFNGNKITSINGSIAKDVNLYAKYQLNPNQLVKTASRLVEIFNDPLATQTSITLNNDIDLNGFILPSIGTQKKGYSATFNGNGFSIKNYIGSNGLFAYTDGATIKDLKIDNANLTNSNNQKMIGILIDTANNTIIENCIVNGDVNITSNTSVRVGGICGYASSVEMWKCTTNVNIDYVFYTSSSWIDSIFAYIGGLIGYCDSITQRKDGCNAGIQRCKSNGLIKIDNEYATAKVGGLIGQISAPFTGLEVIRYCCSDVDLDVKCNNSSVGGLVGDGNITTNDCYAIGNITVQNLKGGKNYIGGITGFNRANVNKCYTDLEINVETFGSSSETYVGGIVGYSQSEYVCYIESCYSIGTIDSYSNNEETILIIGCIYAYSNSPERILYNLELNTQQLVANKGQVSGEIIESDTKYSFEEILNAIHTTIEYPWSDSIWDFYNDKNPTLIN